MADSLLPDTSNLRCWAEIDLEALRHNAAVCRSLSGRNCGVMAIVKADAYGHGLERVVAALSESADWFGVANVREAERARSVTRNAPTGILILSPATPAEIEPIIAGGFSGSVSTIEEVDAYNTAASCLEMTVNLHAVADTGMGRMGAPPESFVALVSAIRDGRHTELEGIDTHFPSADEDPEFTQSQIEQFSGLLKEIAPESSCHIHLGNSAGLIGFHNETPFATLTRPGLALYGINPMNSESTPSEPELLPVMSLKTRVTLVREIPPDTSISYGRTFISSRPMTVATLGVGYGDGYLRHLSGVGAEVLIGGTRCPLLGRVTMDQIVVDVSHLNTKVRCGDVATLIGNQGEMNITANDLAAKAGTIPWEILTGITSRVERVST